MFSQVSDKHLLPFRPSYVLCVFQKYRLHSNVSPMSSVPAIDI